jgi:hypothetical protein
MYILSHCVRTSWWGKPIHAGENLMFVLGREGKDGGVFEEEWLSSDLPGHSLITAPYVSNKLYCRAYQCNDCTNNLLFALLPSKRTKDIDEQ